MSNIGKLVELVAVAIWDLGLDFLELYEGLGSLHTCTHGLGGVGLHLLQALLAAFLGKRHAPQEVGVYSINRFVYL